MARGSRINHFNMVKCLNSLHLCEFSLIDSSNWIVTLDTKTVDYFKTALNAMNGMIQLAATVELLNNYNG